MKQYYAYDACSSEGTQFDFRIKYNLKPSSISSLCNGRIKTHKDWIIVKA